MKKISIDFIMYSQTDWRMPNCAQILVNLLFMNFYGMAEEYRRNQRKRLPLKKLNKNQLLEDITVGNIETFEIFGSNPVPFSHTLMFDSIRMGKGFPIGKHSYGAGWYCLENERQLLPKKFLPLIDTLKKVALPLGLRYACITDHSFEAARVLEKRQWISPQYIRYAHRVMLFGSREIERFGAEYLMNAPVYQSEQLVGGYILLITSPTSLDAQAPEDEAALDSLYDYFMAHPKAGILM